MPRDDIALLYAEMGVLQTCSVVIPQSATSAGIADAHSAAMPSGENAANGLGQSKHPSYIRRMLMMPGLSPRRAAVCERGGGPSSWMRLGVGTSALTSDAVLVGRALL